ncbi:signal recognition particle SRP9/SRP14 subunit [Punctularia strigosozonata HHB-11173 SS5]|uniref:signal recognition particle SRP9/SRP14 subunit n=1 Tax=Punctularia strigosozonata (strain HHB-11173) TaxID=741275 RepID=UPI0004416C43|nr:signal recognition particle SRP9/SRP14 subunit [Punctularia strigosozonata HHB-11173 SS5]EIN05713.1 signal recognition particle SRP9/SRP14 subunit [Punctularia strigosozonata HHB-11173 SS5]
MVYISSWHQFQEAAEELYTKSPEKARYCVKWRALEGRLVLKITDDTSCIKFKTQSSIFLNRFEALNLSLMTKMQNVRHQPAPTTSAPGAAETEREGTPVLAAAAASSAAPGAGGAPAGGGTKKKKPAKKKK